MCKTEYNNAPKSLDAFVWIDNEDRTDPAFNLALEEYALRNLRQDRDYLLLYRNSPSVIVGRNQNILEEVDDFYVRKTGVQVLRRLSGGGAVYHDPGNLNFSFITKYEQSRLHNFRFFNEPLVKVLRSLGVPAEMNDRNDILAGGRKISGNAQFSSRGRMVSHGTLLFNADLVEVDRTLTGRMRNITSRSHKSVRSNVANITEFLPAPMDIHTFRQRLLEGLVMDGISIRRYGLSESDLREIHEIRETKYLSWEWNRGRSPKFQVSRNGRTAAGPYTVHLQVNKGNITEVTFTMDSQQENRLSQIGKILSGIRYEPGEIASALHQNRALLPEHVAAEDLARLLYGEDEP
ncbi:lipoate--protein ligase [Balneolales bacterium ANBcel1]|nr:lipoate--protein ligase [Balneolales bacterium ANBcel1]